MTEFFLYTAFSLGFLAMASLACIPAPETDAPYAQEGDSIGDFILWNVRVWWWSYRSYNPGNRGHHRRDGSRAEVPADWSPIRKKHEAPPKQYDQLAMPRMRGVLREMQDNGITHVVEIPWFLAA